MTMSISKLISQSPERMKHFHSVRLETEVTELLCEQMEKQQVTRAELARRLGFSPPYVSKLLSGNTNMTLKTISDLFYALGRSVRIVDRPLDVHSPRLIVAEITSGPPRGKAVSAYRYNKPTNTRTPIPAAVTGEEQKTGAA